MSKYYHPDSDFYRKVLKQEAPATTTHITEEDIMRNLTTPETRNWRLEGNQLTVETSLGRVTQTIPTDYICTGTDDKGMPILTKIKL